MINNLAREAIKRGGKLYPLIVNSEHKTGLLNPGLFLDKDNLYVNVRHVQYVLYHSENNQFFQTKWGPLAYLHPEQDQTLTTVNYFGTFNNDKLEVSKVNTSNLDVKPIWEFIGLEDARVVMWEDNIYLCGVRRDTTTNGQGRMEMSKIIFEDNEWKEIERYRLDTPYSANTYCEKNWVPINDKPYHFLKWTNPVEVVKVDLTQQMENTFYKCEQVHLSSKVLPLPRDIRGGSNLVKCGENHFKSVKSGEKYLMVTHEVDLFKSELNRKDAFYYHRFFLLGPDYEVIKYSDTFNFLTGNIEFATGLAIKDEEVFITFGFQDNSAFLMKTDINFIEELLNDTE